MKKLLSLALVLTMVLVLAVPALAEAAPAGFVSGTVVTIDKKGYDSFDGMEITANNSTTVFDNFSFVADNKALNAWYINVTDDINGTLEVAYKVGSSYYIVTFDIAGAGKYFIADSKGSNGANMAKIGDFGTHVCEWGEWEVTKEADCQQAGEETRVCKNDPSHIETQEIPALDHNTDGYQVYTPATCEKDGLALIFCTRCGKNTYETIPATEHDLVINWTGRCFDVRWTHTITCNNCDYREGPIVGTPQEHIDAILDWDADHEGADSWYCPICDTYGYKDVWKMEPNLIVTYEWKDLYGLEKSFVDTKIIMFSPVLGERVLAVGTIIDNIRVELAGEWYNDEGQRCYVILGIITIDGVDHHANSDNIDNLSLTIDSDKHTIHFLLGVAIEGLLSP
jgi:hypothetical protein